jgi:hypothetical protein
MTGPVDRAARHKPSLLKLLFGAEKLDFTPDPEVAPPVKRRGLFSVLFAIEPLPKDPEEVRAKPLPIFRWLFAAEPLEERSERDATSRR